MCFLPVLDRGAADDPLRPPGCQRRPSSRDPADPSLSPTAASAALAISTSCSIFAPPAATAPMTSPATVIGKPPGTLVKSRSEEHTSELQSQSNLVCRLLP